MYRMPKVNLNALQGILNAADYAVASRIVNSRTGELRASKPPVPRQIEVNDANSFSGYHYDFATEADAEAGLAAYVWRMVAFQISPKPEHQCMPVMAMCDLPGRTGSEVYKAAEARGDRIAKIVVDSIPPAEWHGVKRWGQAFGMIGTPSYNREGAVIYR